VEPPVIRFRSSEHTAKQQFPGLRPFSREDDPTMAAATDELRTDPMMAHLLDALEQGKDIGHYGRLVFVMVARHFMSEDELIEYLCKDKDCDEEKARALIRQVESRDYNPPRRERILEWMQEQGFPICPAPDDADACNVYRNFEFPKDIYNNIQEYREKKAEAESR
jgi:DNA primase large subunit